MKEIVFLKSTDLSKKLKRYTIIKIYKKEINLSVISMKRRIKTDTVINMLLTTRIKRFVAKILLCPQLGFGTNPKYKVFGALAEHEVVIKIG